jgi:type I restriction enzyme S subunit
MGKWKKVNLGDGKVTELIMGQSPPSNTYNRENIGLPFYQGKKEFGELYPSVEKWCCKPNKIAESGDVLLSVRAPVGPTNLAFEKCCIGRGLASIRPNLDFIGTKFLLFYFQNFELEISLKGQGSTFKAISGKELRSLNIPLPPLPEQQRIVNKLDGLFAKIDQAIGLLEVNIEHTQALMGSVLDEEFSNSKNKLKPIKGLVLKTKTSSPKAEYLNNEFTYIDISSVNKDIFQIESPKVLLGIDAPSRARKVVEKGDVVFATTRPNLKNIAIVSEDYTNPIASTGFCLLRTKKELLNNEYLFYFLISEKVQEYIQPFIKGAQYPAISDKDLLSIEIPFLSIKKQEESVNRIKSIFDVSNNLVATQTQKLNHLKALKSSLLDQAFKGEL